LARHHSSRFTFQKNLSRHKSLTHYTLVFLSRGSLKPLRLTLSKKFPYWLTAFFILCTTIISILSYYSFQYFKLKEYFVIQNEQYTALRSTLERLGPWLAEGQVEDAKKTIMSLTWADSESSSDSSSSQMYETSILSSANLPDLIPVVGKFTSTYGWRPNPISGQQKMHFGVDIAAPIGSAIRSAADGLVTRVGQSNDFGNFIEVKHGRYILTRYAHISKPVVHQNEVVKKGTIIGTVGLTGKTTGPHVHYEVEINGEKVDPAQFFYW